MSTAVAETAPRPTRDLNRAPADLDLYDACVVDAALEAAKLEEVHTAPVALFLSRPDAAKIGGQVVSVDGGPAA